MERQPEPELMDDPAQALAYAEADFSEPHNRFIQEFQRVFAAPDITGTVLDLGCGPADISVRFAQAFPECRIDAVDGAGEMLKLAAVRLRTEGLVSRIRLIKSHLPTLSGLLPDYDTIISNSLLHHLADPAILWQTITRLGRPGTQIFVMDLYRPATLDQVQQLVEAYAADAPEVLRRDFYNSLCAAYRPEEVLLQLQQGRLSTINVERVTDRHFIGYGYFGEAAQY